MPVDTSVVTPISNEHSIKEVVISLFLANPIIKPERFQQLIETDFKDRFQKFEPLSQVELQVKNENGQSPKFNQQVFANIGFKFSAFEKGVIVKVLQGINEKARNFISFHSLNYTRWESFYKEYFNVINTLSSLHPEFFVTAFSLHYIDQFIWNSTNKINLNQIFNSSSKFLPGEFFNSDVNNYNIITEKEIDGEQYLDRIEIIIERNVRPMITISHNVTQPLSDIDELNKIINNSKFQVVLNNCHLHNKKILFDLLRPEISNLINLKITTNG